jgi:hypothetical protein
LEDYKDYEITNSGFFHVSVTTDNGRIKGTLTIKNIGDVTIRGLSIGYVVSYHIYCVAYNTYNLDSKMVVNWRIGYSPNGILIPDK